MRNKTKTTMRRALALLLTAMMCVTLLPMTAMASNTYKKLYLNLYALDTTTYNKYYIGQQTIGNGSDELYQSATWRIPTLASIATDYNVGRVTKVVSTWIGGDKSEGASVEFSTNAQNYTVTYWVEGISPKTPTSSDGGNGGGSTSSQTVTLGSGKYPFSFTIKYHSNYPGGTDYVQTVNYTVNGTYSSAGKNGYSIFQSDMKSYSSLGFTCPQNYSEAHWYNAASGGSKGLLTAYSGGTYHLYAQYTSTVVVPEPIPAKEQVTLKYIDRGSEYASTSLDKDERVQIIGCTNTRTGYTFLGWSTNSSATEASFEPGDELTISANTTLYAVWKAANATLTYNANGGTNPPAAQTETKGTSVKVKDAGTMGRDGYTFLGWSTTENATDADYAAGDTMTLNANTTLYAVWQKNSDPTPQPTDPKVTLIYDANGGEGAPASETKDKIKYNSGWGASFDISTQVPTREGYTFYGWATADFGPRSIYGGAKGAKKITVIDPSGVQNKYYALTLYAQWIKNDGKTYTVIYTDGLDQSNGSAKAFVDQVTRDIPEGSATPQFNGTPTREHYEFAGWSPTVADTVTKNVTYTAKWKQIPVMTADKDIKVIFVDGTNGDQFGELIVKDSKSVLYSLYPKAPDHTGEGYKHIGWSDPVPNDSKDVYVITANYEKSTQYTVTYHWGNSVTSPEIYSLDLPAQETYTAGETVVLKLPATVIDGEGNKIAFEKLQSMLSDYYVTFTWRGWADSYLGGEKDEIIADNTFVMPAKDVHVYARWDEQYPPLYSGGGGGATTGGAGTPNVKWVNGYDDAVIDEKPVLGTMNNEAIVPLPYPADPTRDGYTFAGWSDPVKDGEKGENDLYNYTITALWEKNGPTMVDTEFTIQLAFFYLENGRADIPDDFKFEMEITNENVPDFKITKTLTKSEAEETTNTAPALTWTINEKLPQSFENAAALDTNQGSPELHGLNTVTIKAVNGEVEGYRYTLRSDTNAEDAMKGIENREVTFAQAGSTYKHEHKYFNTYVIPHKSTHYYYDSVADYNNNNISGTQTVETDGGSSTRHLKTGTVAWSAIRNEKTTYTGKNYIAVEKPSDFKVTQATKNFEFKYIRSIVVKWVNENDDFVNSETIPNGSDYSDLYPDDLSETGDWGEPEKDTDGNITIKWTEPPVVTEYTVTYTDGVDDEEVFADKTYTVEENSATPKFDENGANPTRDGYVFDGWDPEVAETVTGDVTYKATWKEDKNKNGVDDDKDPKYTVTYTDGVDNEEVFADQKHENVLVDMDTPKFEGTPTRDGYVFDGWDPEVADTVTKDVTYTATWECAHDHEDGYCTDPDCKHDDDCCPKPVEAGYAVEWYDIDKNELIKTDSTRKGNVGDTVSVTEDDKVVDGYTFDEDNEDNVLEATLEENGTVLKLYFTKDVPPEPTKAGYIVEWYVTGESEPIKTDSTREGNVDEDVSVTDADKTIDGYIFDEDNEDNVLTETLAEDGSTVLKLYFKVKTYNVKWVDGDEVLDEQDVKTGEGIPENPDDKIPEAPEGKEFDKWSDPETDPESGDVIIRVIWKDKPTPVEPEVKVYTVTYTDGVEGVEIFEDEVYTNLKEGVDTPVFGTSGDLFSTEDGVAAVPTRTGYKFKGWSPAVEDTVTGDAIYVAQWSKNSTSGSGSGDGGWKKDDDDKKDDDKKDDDKKDDDNNGGSTPTGGGNGGGNGGSTPTGGGGIGGGNGNEITIDDPDVPLANVPNLNSFDHFAYINGYEDGTVRPESNISRAEVATIFFRLMTDAFRAQQWSSENDYSDVSEGEWYNNAISTTSNAGIVTGYNDGTFRPNDAITRAEFATMAIRFLAENPEAQTTFSDINGHWAENNILEAVAVGWINGYDDSTFRPDQPITRAETATLVNRMLNRHPATMLEGAVVWPDNPEGTWYYKDIQEATNAHDYDGDEDGEHWTSLIANRDWTELER